ncbi:hypothetical protein FOA52_012190 [Chlamydomonas sp. UWO 241]|nr:hypothetical protein FOA52_012190 [Chlamydomonas sp. UWO 241]
MPPRRARAAAGPGGGAAPPPALLLIAHVDQLDTHVNQLEESLVDQVARQGQLKDRVELLEKDGRVDQLGGRLVHQEEDLEDDVGQLRGYVVQLRGHFVQLRGRVQHLEEDDRVEHLDGRVTATQHQMANGFQQQAARVGLLETGLGAIQQQVATTQQDVVQLAAELSGCREDLKQQRARADLMEAETLCLREPSKLPLRDLRRLLEHCTELHSLRMWSSGLESLEGIQACSQLTRLHLYDIPRISSLEPLAACSKLKWLNIKDCVGLESLEPLSACKKLKILSISDCHKDLVGMKALKAALPHLHIRKL